MQIYNMILIHKNLKIFYGIYNPFLSLIRYFFFYFYHQMQINIHKTRI